MMTGRRAEVIVGVVETPAGEQPRADMGHTETATLWIDGSRTEAGGFRLQFKDQEIILSAVAFKTWLRLLLSRVGDPNKTLPVATSPRDIHSLKYELGRQRSMQVFDIDPEDIDFDWDILAEVDDDNLAHVLAELKVAISTNSGAAECPESPRALKDEGDPLGLKEVVLGGDAPTLSSEAEFVRKRPPASSK